MAKTMSIVKDGKLKHYNNIKVVKGALGDMETEWWTQEDWDKHNADIERWRLDGTLGEVSYVNLTLMHHPLFDTPTVSTPAKESHRIIFLNYGEENSNL